MNNVVAYFDTSNDTYRLIEVSEDDRGGVSIYKESISLDTLNVDLPTDRSYYFLVDNRSSISENEEFVREDYSFSNNTVTITTVKQTKTLQTLKNEEQTRLLEFLNSEVEEMISDLHKFETLKDAGEITLNTEITNLRTRLIQTRQGFKTHITAVGGASSKIALNALNHNYTKYVSQSETKFRDLNLITGA